MDLDWQTCKGDVWCKLNTVNLDHSHFENMDGVYIIWHGGSNPHTVRIGQGHIKDRIAAHRNDTQVQAYAKLGLYVTWASVPTGSRDGVEVYLAQELSPKLGQRYPEVIPISANLPWN